MPTTPFDPPALEQGTLRITPLGGLGEVGRNMTVFEYGGKLLVVDIDPFTAVGHRLRDARRRALARSRAALPDPPVVELEPASHSNGRPVRPDAAAPLLDELEEMRLALELGLRSYVEKNGFREYARADYHGEIVLLERLRP